MFVILRRAVRSVLFLNILLFVGLPAGSFDYFKIPFVGVLVMLMALMSHRIIVRNSMAAITLSVVTAVSASLLYVLVAGRFDADALVEYRSFILMASIIMIFVTLYKNGLFSYYEMLKAMITGSVAYIIIKLTLIAVLFFVPGSLGIIHDVISQDLVPMGSMGLVGLERFVSINDYLILFLYFYIDGLNIGKAFRHALKTLFLISLLLSFARFVWVAFGVLYFADCLVKKKYHRVITLPVLVVFSLVAINEFTEVKILDAIAHRTGEEGSLSTSAKKEQSVLLLDEIAEYPLVGKGIGAYIENYIRNDRLKYGYEVFILLIFMQFGIVGGVALFLLLVAPFIRWLFENRFVASKKSLFTLLAFVLYLSSAFTNPVILSATSAFLLSFLYIAGDFESDATRARLRLLSCGAR